MEVLIKWCGNSRDERSDGDGERGVIWEEGINKLIELWSKMCF